MLNGPKSLFSFAAEFRVSINLTANNRPIRFHADLFGGDKLQPAPFITTHAPRARAGALPPQRGALPVRWSQHRPGKTARYLPRDPEKTRVLAQDRLKAGPAAETLAQPWADPWQLCHFPLGKRQPRHLHHYLSANSAGWIRSHQTNLSPVWLEALHRDRVVAYNPLGRKGCIL